MKSGFVLQIVALAGFLFSFVPNALCMERHKKLIQLRKDLEDLKGEGWSRDQVISTVEGTGNTDLQEVASGFVFDDASGEDVINAVQKKIDELLEQPGEEELSKMMIESLEEETRGQPVEMVQPPGEEELSKMMIESLVEETRDQPEEMVAPPGEEELGLFLLEELTGGEGLQPKQKAVVGEMQEMEPEYFDWVGKELEKFDKEKYSEADFSELADLYSFLKGVRPLMETLDDLRGKFYKERYPVPHSSDVLKKWILTTMFNQLTEDRIPKGDLSAGSKYVLLSIFPDRERYGEIPRDAVGFIDNMSARARYRLNQKGIRKVKTFRDAFLTMRRYMPEEFRRMVEGYLE